MKTIVTRGGQEGELKKPAQLRERTLREKLIELGPRARMSMPMTWQTQLDYCKRNYPTTLQILADWLIDKNESIVRRDAVANFLVWAALNGLKLDPIRDRLRQGFPYGDADLNAKVTKALDQKPHERASIFPQ